MKESFNYEEHIGEIKKSFAVGTACIGALVRPLYQELKPIVEYQVRSIVREKETNKRRGV